MNIEYELHLALSGRQTHIHHPNPVVKGRHLLWICTVMNKRILKYMYMFIALFERIGIEDLMRLSVDVLNVYELN